MFVIILVLAPVGRTPRSCPRASYSKGMRVIVPSRAVLSVLTMPSNRIPEFSSRRSLQRR